MRNRYRLRYLSYLLILAVCLPFFKEQALAENVSAVSVGAGAGTVMATTDTDESKDTSGKEKAGTVSDDVSYGGACAAA